MGGKSRKGGGVSSRLIAQLKYGNYQANESAQPSAADKRQRKTRGERQHDESSSSRGLGLLDE